MTEGTQETSASCRKEDLRRSTAEIDPQEGKRPASWWVLKRKASTHREVPVAPQRELWNGPKVVLEKPGRPWYFTGNSHR